MLNQLNNCFSASVGYFELDSEFVTLLKLHGDFPLFLYSKKCSQTAQGRGVTGVLERGRTRSRVRRLYVPLTE
jgi:hypothetical protein